MRTYKYVIVVTGTVEAEHDVNAKLQVLMGVTLTTRLLQTPHNIAIKIAEEEAEEVEEPVPIKARVTTPRRKGGS